MSDVKLCIHCKHINNVSIDGKVHCLRLIGPIDPVTGVSRRSFTPCDDARLPWYRSLIWALFNYATHCGPAAKFYEAKEGV